MLNRGDLERATPELPPSFMGLVGRLHGIQVFDWSDEGTREHICKAAGLPATFDLRYDEMYPAYSIAAIIVGEQAHFVYRMRQIVANEGTRLAASTHILVVAERILGEPWELSDQ